MTLLEAKRIAINHTLACWWPSRAFPKPEPNWMGICCELVELSRNELSMRETPNQGIADMLANAANKLADRYLTE